MLGDWVHHLFMVSHKQARIGSYRHVDKIGACWGDLGGIKDESNRALVICIDLPRVVGHYFIIVISY